MHLRTRGTQTQAVIIAHKEISKKETTWEKVSYCFSIFVLLGQLFYNDNKSTSLSR